VGELAPRAAAGDVRMVTNSWHLDGLPDPPDDSVVGTPARRAGSIRRTTHLNATWPDGDGGFGAAVRLAGRARDLVTPVTGDPVVRALDELELELDATRSITAFTVTPDRAGAAQLVGASGFRGFRAAVAAALPDERPHGTALAFVLDDVPPVSMIGGIAWAQHRPLDIPLDEKPSGDALSFQKTASGRIACSGLRPGGYQHRSLERGITFPHWIRPAGDLGSDDPWAWHELHPAAEVCFRRRRRMDVWRAGERIEVDAHFRDSVWGPAHDEIALHEYTLTASIDGDDVLRSLSVRSRVLPFPECPSAAIHAQTLVGSDVTELRPHVGEVLTELHACTHLNDMLRGLADVPALVRAGEQGT
jgi:hypothetical protein